MDRPEAVHRLVVRPAQARIAAPVAAGGSAVTALDHLERQAGQHPEAVKGFVDGPRPAFVGIVEKHQWLAVAGTRECRYATGVTPVAHCEQWHGMYEGMLCGMQGAEQVASGGQQRVQRA